MLGCWPDPVVLAVRLHLSEAGVALPALAGPALVLAQLTGRHTERGRATAPPHGRPGLYRDQIRAQWILLTVSAYLRVFLSDWQTFAVLLWPAELGGVPEGGCVIRERKERGEVELPTWLATLLAGGQAFPLALFPLPDSSVLLILAPLLLWSEAGVRLSLQTLVWITGPVTLADWQSDGNFSLLLSIVEEVTVCLRSFN